MSSNPETGGAPPWIVDRRGAALVARLDRPAARNALNFACWQTLEGLLDQADGDPGIRAFIIAGSDTIFSAGGDMKAPEPRGDGLMKGAARLKYLQTVLARLARLSVPSIAAVEGPAIGVAWGLALTCDFVVAAKGAMFVAPFLERSLVPDGGLAWHLVRAAGRLRATEILLGNRKLSAEEAREYGLVTEVVAPGEALARSEAIAASFASTSRDTILLALRALRKAEHGSHRDYLDAELELAALNLHSPEIAAARMSFKKPAAAAGTKGDR
jgi:2-(1,2-epoxy-1,2-dihydrophenyl)acetyl-CoA isomerase